MDFFTKNKWALWSIIILVILNIFTLGTLWFKFRPLPLPPPGPEAIPTRNVQRFLMKELELNREQIQKFKQLRAEHFKQSRKTRKKIHQLKKEMMDELFKPEPDTLKINKLAKKIGEKQTKMEKLISSHFLGLKSVCNINQQKKLQELLNEYFQPGEPPMGSPRKRSGRNRMN